MELFQQLPELYLLFLLLSLHADRVHWLRREKLFVTDVLLLLLSLVQIAYLFLRRIPGKSYRHAIQKEGEEVHCNLYRRYV